MTPCKEISNGQPKCVRLLLGKLPLLKSQMHGPNPVVLANPSSVCVERGSICGVQGMHAA